MTRKRWMWVVLLLVGMAMAAPSALRLYYRVDHLPLLLHASRQHGVSPYLVAAVIFTESRFRPEARSHAGAAGLMQLMPETAREVAEKLGLPEPRPEDLQDPELNITLGVAYLKYLSGRFPNPEMVLAAYNAGPTIVEHWQDQGMAIPYAETQKYITSVRTHRRWLEQLYPGWD